jgi:hypothetical protein
MKTQRDSAHDGVTGPRADQALQIPRNSCGSADPRRRFVWPVVRRVASTLVTSAAALGAALVVGGAAHAGDSLPVVPPSTWITLPYLPLKAAAGDETGLVLTDSQSSVVFTLDGDPTTGPWSTATFPSPQPFSQWGQALARNDNRLAIGTPFRIQNGFPVGSVSVASREGNGPWTIVADLFGPAPGSLFGSAVALDGDTLAVGSPNQTVTGLSGAGSVSIYERVNGLWTLTGTLTSDVPTANERFGSAIALDGDRLAVGGTGSSRAGPASSGALWIFERSRGSRGASFGMSALLTSPAALAGDQLGASVDLLGDVVIGGAPSANTTSAGAGAAVVGIRSGSQWSLQRLVPPPSQPSEGFGLNVAAGKDRVIVGVFNVAAPGSTMAMEYRRTGGQWTATAQVYCEAPLTPCGPRLAAMVPGTGGQIALFRIDLDCPSSLVDNDCNDNFLADDCEIAAGEAVDVNLDGVPDDCAVARVVLDIPSDVTPGPATPFLAHLAATEDHVAAMPYFLEQSGYSSDCPQWGSFVPGIGAGGAIGLPVPCFSYAGGEPYVIRDGWAAIGGLEVGSIGKVSLFDVPKAGSPDPVASFSASTVMTWFGFTVAATDDELFVPRPVDPSGAYPIRHYRRDASGAWSETSEPIFVPNPGLSTGVALAVAPIENGSNVERWFAVSDLTDATPTFEAGRVRVFRLLADDTLLEDAELRLADIPNAQGSFGNHVAIVGERLVTTWTSSQNEIRRVFVYRRTSRGAWAPEADLLVETESAFSKWSRDISVRGNEIAVARASGGVHLFRRAANGAWVDGETVGAPLEGFFVGGAVALVGNGRLVAIGARDATPDPIAEAWLLDPVTDCNGNHVDDSAEIASGAESDANLNGLPDSCERPGDLDGDGAVTPTDLGLLLGRFGEGPGLGDLTDDGAVDAADIGVLLGDWGR